MSDLNITNIHNDEDIEVCAKLEHHLDFISKNPGIYPFDEVAKLIDKGKFLIDINYLDEDKEFLRNIFP